jgi:subtilisin family serine protease
MHRRGLSLVLVLPVLIGTFGAGCLSSEAPPSPSAFPASMPADPVVVALIDTGVNPYHAAFRAQSGNAVVDESVLALTGAHSVALSSNGSYETRLAADDGFWGSVEPGTLYAFPGTRLMAISLSNKPGEPLVLDTRDHGTGTAALVAREAPDTIIVMIQVDVTICDPLMPLEACSIFSQAAPGMAWAAEQPWIDVISLSLGRPANAPYDTSMQAFVDASKRAHENGKLVLSAAGNTVVPPLAAYYAGPPWVIAVGGAQAASHGESADAAKGADVLANFTEYVASQNSVNDYIWTSGTSLSTPIVSGTLAQAIAEVRAQGKVTTPKAVRDALNATAAYFQATEWDPTKPPTNDTRFNLLTHSLPVAAPFAQMGWGYVHGGMANEIARRVLAEDFALPPEKEQTAAYMAQYQALREAYWSQYT